MSNYGPIKVYIGSPRLPMEHEAGMHIWLFLSQLSPFSHFKNLMSIYRAISLVGYS